MSAVTLISRLREAGIELFLSNGSLHYRCPKGKLTPEIHDELVRHKPALEKALALLPRDWTGRSSGPLVRRTDRRNDAQLSFPQERLWFEEQLNPGGAAYNVPVAVRLKGRLDVQALERSLTAVVLRHEALRTTFHWSDNRPVQRVGEPWEVHFNSIDVRSFIEEERESRVGEWIRQEASRAFDLENDRLFRAGLVQVADEEHVVLLVLHHIVSDAWSMAILLREITALYRGEVEGAPVVLEALPVQYADYAVWQRRWLQGPVLEGHLEYWRKRLGGLGEIRRLPPDGQGGPRRGGMLLRQWNSALRDALSALARQQRVTLFMTVAAGLAVVLGREMGSPEITIGADVANRHRAEVEGLIGFFVNVVVLRIDLRGYPQFCDLLGNVREQVLEANAHQEVPFERVVEELQPERKAGQTPLFQVLLVVQNIPLPPMRLSGIVLEPVEIDNETAKFDLALFVREGAGGITGNWNYRRDLFHPETVERLNRALEAVLTAVAADPHLLIRSLRMNNSDANQLQDAPNIEKPNLRFAKRRPVRVTGGDLVKRGPLQEGGERIFPLVIEPSLDGVDLVEWAREHREEIARDLHKHGGILFRGFDIRQVDQFETFASTQCSELFGEYGDLPRAGVGGQVYQSTPYPCDETILFHNESSHQVRWPHKILFFCVQPSAEGGATPIVDCRDIYANLDPSIRNRFEEEGLLYVRNYVDGLDVSWRDFFHTEDRSAVEQICAKSGVEWEWMDNGSLQTKQRRKAVIEHPHTGEKLFFNQIQLHHVSCLAPTVRESLRSLYGDRGLPRNVYYGNGGEIADDVVQEMVRLYRQKEATFPWHKGDIVMLDNMMVAHARNPYRGERRIVVAMGDMIEGQLVQSV